MKIRHAIPSALSWALLHASFSVAVGCGGDAPATDGGLDGGTDAMTPEVDAEVRPDAPGGCIEGTVPGAWSLVTVDDVTAAYNARITPNVGSQPWDLYFESRHMFDPDTGGPVDLAGTFELGTGSDDNYGTCAHCVIAFYGTMQDRGYFARAGTMTVAADPFELDLDVVIEDLELVEVTIDPIDLTSTVVPGGDCIHLERVEIDQTFSPPGWTCGADTFEDGAVCNCECGILDRDCSDPSLPIAGCTAGQLCRPIVAGPIGPFFGDSVCANDCDREAGVGCPGTQACVDHAFGDLCNATATEIDRNADLGEICVENALHCAIGAMGMSNGYCDLFARADRRCQPRCSVDTDCNTAIFEHCYVGGADGSGETEVPFGYCALRYPDGWTCSGAAYQDGTTCDCECGLVDPDCYDPALPVAGCESGEVCNEGNCAAPAP